MNKVNHLIKKRYFIIIFIVLVFVVHSFIHINKNKLEDEYLNQKTNTIFLEYQVIYNKNKDFADLVFQTEINQLKVIELFKNRKRQELQQFLLANYTKLRTFNIRQLHFHLPNNDSFLRMHRPKKFGDNLSKDRLTVKYVNENLKPIDGFEEGKIFNGFRFVYPLFDKNKHIGSVEISFSALAFIKDIVSEYRIISNFHIDKKVVDDKVFKDEKFNYNQSPLPQFYCQKSIVDFIGVDLSKIRNTKEQTEDVYNKIKIGEPFSIENVVRKEIVTFIPLKNPITKEVVAAFSFSTNDKTFIKTKRYSFIIFIVLVLVIAITLVLIYKELRYKLKLEANVKRKTHDIEKSVQLLNNVIKGSNLGYWDWFPQTKEHYVNDRWLEILGLDRDDITNTETDWSQKVIPEDLELIIPIIEDAIEKNEPFRIEFRMLHKDGHYVWIQSAGSVVEKDSSKKAVRVSGTHTDITHSKKVEEELKLFASTDSMTKLYNRRYFIQISESILELAKRNKTDVSTIILDIDNFKNINDTYGHKVGDDVIILLSSKLKQFSRNSDIVSRWGGEEFVILLPETDIDGALIIAEKIRTNVENIIMNIGNNVYVKFTVSLGISQFYDKKDSDIEASIHRADEALYKAKNSGRNMVCTN